MAAIMQSPAGKYLTRGTTYVLQECGLSERSATIVGSILSTMAVSYGVSMVGGSLNRIQEMSTYEARDLDYQYSGVTGAQDFAKGGRYYRDILYSSAADDPMTHFYKVLDFQGNLVGTYVETPISAVRWMGPFAPMHTAAWAPVSSAGAATGLTGKMYNFGRVYAQYAGIGVCHNTSSTLLNQTGAFMFSPVQLGFRNVIQYSFTDAWFSGGHWLTGRYFD